MKTVVLSYYLMTNEFYVAAHDQLKYLFSDVSFAIRKLHQATDGHVI